MRLPRLTRAALVLAASLLVGCGSATAPPVSSASDGTTLPSGKPVGTPLPSGDFCDKVDLGSVARALGAATGTLEPATYLADGSPAKGPATRTVGNTCLFRPGARGTVEVTVFERQNDTTAMIARNNVEALGCSVTDAPAYGDPGFLGDCVQQRTVIGYGLNGSAAFGCKINFVAGSGPASRLRDRADGFCRTALAAIQS